MTRYTVARNYRAVYKSQPIGFDQGATVDVDDDVAEWVNADSPGCLVPGDSPAAADEAAADEAAADEAAADEAAATTPAPRSRKR